jgi:hypothetical protein
MEASVAFAEIEKQAGKQFDPVFATGFLTIKDAILREMQVQTAAPVTRRLRTVPV